MEVLSWNCRGINNDATIQALKRLNQKHKPSMVFFVELSDEHSLPWVVMGDFNELLHAHEKVGGWRRTERQMQGFRDALSYGDLFDIGYLGMSFTWKDSETKCRLDRAVASAIWTDLFSVARVTHLPPSRSDHIPLLLGVYASNPPACSFIIAFDLKVFGFKMMVVVLWSNMEVFDSPIIEASTLQSAHLQSILEGLLQQESDYWKQRAKVLWLTDGDRNTKYFHRKASNRRAKNMIKGLFDSDGVWQDSDIGLENIVLNYFYNMFRAGAPHPEQLNEVTNLIKPSITQEMNIDLCSPYSEEEIHLALFQMHPTKSPGPDGMPPQFFQQYWTTVGPSIVSAVQNFLHTGQLLKEINFTHVCLIPKVKEPETMAHLRPIALCNVIYKLCAKVLANRLKKLLPQIVSPFQSAFVPGRLITDNTLVANEISHFIHTKRSGPDGYMSLKLDMSKAYDRIEWNFLEAVLTRLGFAAHWISIIMQCVTTVRYSFIVNGKSRGYITPSRGLRQGDPLSPFLFLLCTEGFSSLLTQKATLGLLQGVSICASAPPVHHLLFADDSLLFARTSLADCDHIKQVLYTYELASGQKVNFTKSSIVFSKNVCSSLHSSIAFALHMLVVPVHEKYLGLPTYVGRGKVDTFSYIKERLTKKLEGWQGKMLSGAGKDILVRVCAQALPTYAMNCFLLPKKSCDELQQLCAKFWWGSSPDKKKIHWLNWDALCKPKEEGGLSFRNLHLFNLAMLAKQAWRIVQNPSSLISQLYKAQVFSRWKFLVCSAIC
ncbi:hypothetical protein M0R45_018961 [Rubus argutus]|uniref:Reverse transcriptase domain-containing protein n=1 Tax=Rubus argutus TaxID=59490 RepID=A0AAW1X6P3_RUBAR